jgi:hypothetical protein
MLFDGFAWCQFDMKFLIVAKYDPALSTNLGQPFIVRRLLFEMKFISRIVMIFDSKRRLHFPQSLWKALAKTSVKIKCQRIRDLAFPLLGPTPSKSRALRTCSRSRPKSSAISLGLSPAFHRPLMIQVGVPSTAGAPNEIRGSMMIGEDEPATCQRMTMPSCSYSNSFSRPMMSLHAN